MYEWRRILLNKKMLLFLGVMLLLNIGLYVRIQNLSYSHYGSVQKYTDTMQGYIEEIKDLSIADSIESVQSEIERFELILDINDLLTMKEENPESFKEYGEQTLKQYQEQYPEVFIEMKEHPQDNEKNVIEPQQQVLYLLLNRLQYMNSYSEKIQTVMEQEKTLSQVSIFKDTNSLSIKNLQKTSLDYGRLSEVNLSLGIDELIASVVSFKEIHYLMLVIIFALVFQVFSERKRGLWPVIHTTAKGRGKLAANRAGIMLTSVGVMTILMYGVLILCSVYLYGEYGEFGRLIQSIEMFQDFVHPMTVGQFVIIFILCNMLAYFLLIILIWFVLSILQNRNIALLVIGVIFGLGYLWYTILSEQSNLVLLKYVNAFYLIDITEAFTSYWNLNIFGWLVNKFEFTIAIVIIGFIGFLAGSIYVNHRVKPFKQMSVLEQIFTNIANRVRRITEKFHVFGLELYKVLVLQKGIIILLAFVYLGVTSGSVKTVTYSVEESYLNYFCENYGGKISDEARAYLQELENEIQQKQMELDQVEEAYQLNQIGYAEYIEGIANQKDLTDMAKGANAIREKLDYVEQIEEKCQNGWIVNDRGYRMLLGEKEFQEHKIIAIKAIFCLILLLAGIFGFEKKSGIVYSLRSTRKGRKNLYCKKIVVVALLTFVVGMITYGTEFYYIGKTYGLGSFQANIVNVDFLSGLGFDCSLGQFLAFVYGIRFILLFAIAMIVVFISMNYTTEVTILFASALLLIPSIVSLLGVTILDYVSIIRPVGVMEILLSNGGKVKLISCLILIILLGLLATVKSFQMWNNTGRRSKKKC